jgi:nickel/cobalt exporter
MIELITGTLVISVLHGLIPSHWLPIVAIGKKENWSMGEVRLITLLSAAAHALSTILIGLALSMLGWRMAHSAEHFTHLAAPLILVVLGVFFIYRHHRHQHFQLQPGEQKILTKPRIVAALALAMFLSPCLEIEAYFLLAGTQGWRSVALVSLSYLLITIASMLIWIQVMYRGAMKLNWHAIEHNAGIITGVTLILTGIVTLFLHG